MRLNSFKVRTGKPMIDSLESAKEFLAQCKVVQDIKIARTNKTISCFAGDDKIPCKFSIYEKVDDWTDLEKSVWYGDAAIKKCYEYRKYINARFRN